MQRIRGGWRDRHRQGQRATRRMRRDGAHECAPLHRARRRMPSDWLALARACRLRVRTWCWRRPTSTCASCKEMAPGTPFTIRGGVVGRRGDALRCFAEIRNTASGEPAATCVTDLYCVAPRDGTARPFPVEVAERIAPLQVEIPPHAAPRGLGFEPPAALPDAHAGRRDGPLRSLSRRSAGRGMRPPRDDAPRWRDRPRVGWRAEPAQPWRRRGHPRGRHGQRRARIPPGVPAPAARGAIGDGDQRAAQPGCEDHDLDAPAS